MIDAIAIGRFDGLHLGHKELFRHLGDAGAILAIDTSAANLTPPEFISSFIQQPVFIYKLEEIRELDAKGFVQKLKADFPSLKKIVVGEDFRFGKDRAYDASALKQEFQQEVLIIKEVRLGSTGVHSKHIRKLLLEGKIAQANKFLGRNYEIRGGIVHGQGIGANHLAATLNMRVEKFLLPNEGVYATRAFCDGRFRPAVTFIGHRISTDGNFAVETHIIEHTPEENVSSLRIVFLDKIRPNRYYDTLEKLKKAIAKDIKKAREINAKLSSTL